MSKISYLANKTRDTSPLFAAIPAAFLLKRSEAESLSAWKPNIATDVWGKRSGIAGLLVIAIAIFLPALAVYKALVFANVFAAHNLMIQAIFAKPTTFVRRHLSIGAVFAAKGAMIAAKSQVFLNALEIVWFFVVLQSLKHLAVEIR